MDFRDKHLAATRLEEIGNNPLALLFQFVDFIMRTFGKTASAVRN